MSKLWEVFLIFLKVGSFTFGGGYAMIPLIQKEIVEKKKWLEIEEFIDVMAIAQAAPGAIAINAATYSGFKIAGTNGALVAALAATLPSLITLIVVAALFTKFEANPLVITFFKGIRPAIVALIISAAYSVGKNVLKNSASIIVCFIALVALTVFKLNPILVILLGGLWGYLIYLYHKSKEVEQNVV